MRLIQELVKEFGEWDKSCIGSIAGPGACGDGRSVGQRLVSTMSWRGLGGF